MKIGVKIVLIVVVAVLGLIVSAVFSISGLDEVNDMFTYVGDVPIKNGNTANECLNNLNEIARASAMAIVVQHDEKASDVYLDRIHTAADDLMSQFDTLLASVSEGGKPKVLACSTAINDVRTARAELERLLHINAYDSAANYRAGFYQDKMGAAINALADYVDYTDEQIHEYVYVTSDERAEATETTLYIVMVAVLIILIVVAIFIITGITKPLKKAVEAAEKVAIGELEGLDLSTNSKDETGVLLNAFQTMVNAIEALAVDASSLAKSAAAGNLSTRADASKHKGSYQDIIAGVNTTLDDVVGPLNMAADYVEQIAHGITPPKITDVYHGDFNKIKNNLNTCIDSLTVVISNIETIATDAGNGVLSTRADASKVENTWSVLLKGVNGIVENADNIINDAGKTLSTMATGDLTPRITAAYKGKFGEMKDNINNLGDSLTDL
ncbi:MAG: HAMP domain-containing protein, partial [Ignavibacteria bacterium]|nr:HAMP domain-containing protein [Ignavibacteria bacterium]